MMVTMKIIFVTMVMVKAIMMMKMMMMTMMMLTMITGSSYQLLPLDRIWACNGYCYAPQGKTNNQVQNI
jgi:hypothetical protein